MDEASLRSILGRVGIRPGRANRKGWIPFPCPFAQWTHKGGRDSRASAAALVNPEGKSSFVCKGCHHHGTIGRLINLLASFRSDDSIRPLMVEADHADANSAIAAGFGGFERTLDIEAIEPVDEAQFDGLYEPASDVPAAMNYLEARRIGRDTADLIELKWEPRQRRILFPVRDRAGALYGFSGRAVDPHTEPKIRDYFGLPKRHLILGENRWQAGKPLILVEGLFGFASLVEQRVEFIANIGAMLGAVLTPEKAERVRALDEPTYLLFDPDTGGDMGLFGTVGPDGLRDPENGAIAQLQGHVPLFVPEWPEGVGDPDELTFDQVAGMLQDTPLYSVEGDISFDNSWERSYHQ